MQPDAVAMERAATRALAAHPETPIGCVIRRFERWLHVEDAGPLEVVLGAVAGNMMPGDPVWLLLVGPPGGGKTEILRALSKVPRVHMAATLTEASLLSGTPRREKAQDASGGLLRQIGGFGFIVCKDFTSILSMHRDSRASVLAALRECFDGEWTRYVGVDGGRTLRWAGKLVLIAGVTPAIDSHHAVVSMMGERFLMYRLPAADAHEQAGRAIEHSEHEATMRRELAEAVAGLFRSVNVDSLPALPPAAKERLIALAMLAARCRSAVERDGYNREVVLVPDSEAPGRLALGLSRLYAGMVAIGVPEAERWRLVSQTALDSMPSPRRAVFEVLRKHPGTLSTTEISERTRYPTATARRALEDLTAHGIVDRQPGGEGRSDLWAISAWAAEQYRRGVEGTLPEMSGEALEELTRNVA